MKLTQSFSLFTALSALATTTSFGIVSPYHQSYSSRRAVSSKLNVVPIIISDDGEETMIEPKFFFFFWRKSKVPSLDNLPLGTKLTGAKKMHEEGLTGKGVKVAVIDSGMDGEHEVLEDSIKKQLWFRYGAIDTTPHDHGTHVGGTIHFMAPDAELYDYRVFGNSGGMSVSRGICKAIYDAVDEEGCDIINMSLGGPRVDYNIYRAVRYAYKKNVIMVVAAGNSGDDDPLTNELSYPACFPEVISIGAVRKEDDLPVAKFSNTNAQVDYAGIGVDVLSARPNNKYQEMSGTSMACPHACGFMASLMTKGGKYEDLIKDDASLRQLLNDKFCVDIGIKGPDNATGLGFLTYLTKDEFDDML